MSWKQALNILTQEFSDSANDIECVDLLGGEPLTNFQLIPQICEWIWKNRPEMKVFARTNGTLLSTEMKNWFIENKDRFTLGLSIDGLPEVNLINRGIKYLDIDFFQEHWPENPIKMTIFPESVEYLSSSLQSLYDRGLKIIGGLAQGILWDAPSCILLKEQLDNLTKYYLSKPHIEPLEPLFDFNFHKAFWIPNSPLEADPPCWIQADIHTYDCDGDLLPCHMFSSIIQGKEKRKTILSEAMKVEYELLPQACMKCPIRWCCKNCMAMNYQHTGDFGYNINLDYMCEAQKIVACASAKILVSKTIQSSLSIDSEEQYQAISNAIKYLKLSGEIIHG